MLGVENFNNISNGTTFDPHQLIFANLSEPADDDTTIIDLSSGGETDEFETETVINAASTGSSNFRKRHLHSTENLSGNKRKHNDNSTVQLYNESQKNRNRNVPLKKRGASNREEELNFLNLIAIEDSNHHHHNHPQQAQNLKIECSNDLTTCDSSSSSSAPQNKLYHDLEPKDNSSSSSNSNSGSLKSSSSNSSSNKNENTPSTTSLCNCLNCFPSLGSSGSSRIKCRKLKSSPESVCSSSSSDAQASSSTSLNSDLIPGPSGIQKNAPSSSIPVKKRVAFLESDDDYDSDEHEIPPASVPETERNVDALRAPHLQLDWLSDTSSQDEEEVPEDDDVIFVNDRSEPIDLTADSDNEPESNNTSATNSNSNTNSSSSSSKQPSASSVDAFKRSIDKRSNGEGARESSRQSSTVNGFSVFHPAHLGTGLMSFPSLPDPPVPQRAHSDTIGARTTSNVITHEPETIQQNNIPTIILPTPPVIPAPSMQIHRINLREMITGNDVMLFDGGAQNFSTNSRESGSARTRNSPPPLCNISNEPPRITEAGLSRREPNQNSTSNSSSSNTCSNSNFHHGHHHHHRRHFHPAYNTTSSSSYHVEDLTTTQSSNTQHTQAPQQQQQSGRPHSVGRCPFMTEGHHYNRPRRLARDFYPLANNRPYAIHEDLWRRQYQEQEIRRHYWSNAALNNNETPEVQVHMVHMDPVANTPVRVNSLYREDPNANGNPTNELLNSRYRMQQRIHRRSW